MTHSLRGQPARPASRRLRPVSAHRRRSTAAAWALAMGAAGWALSGCTAAPDPGPPAAAPSTAVSSPAPAPSGTATPTPSRSASTAPATPSLTAPVEATVEIRIADGKIEPNVQTVKVRAGQAVTIRGVSDVAESLHVHGYDKTLDLKPGEPAELTFTADVKGVFEIETHESEKLAAKLNVS